MCANHSQESEERQAQHTCECICGSVWWQGNEPEKTKQCEGKKNCSWFLILEILKKSPFGWGPHRSLISPSLLSLFGFCAFVKDGFTAFLLTSLSSSLSWFSQFMGQNNVPYLKKVRLPYTKHTAKCLANPLLRTDDCFAKFKFVLESNGIM